MKRLLAVLAAGLFAAAWVSQAAALSIITEPISFPAVALDGSDQTVSGTVNAWLADATGESGGWNLTVASSDFVNGNGKTIPVGNLEMRLQDSNIVLVLGDANGPTSSLTDFTALSDTPLKIATAASGEGDGTYEMTPDFRLTVPAETYSGSYTATVTVAINVGP